MDSNSLPMQVADTEVGVHYELSANNAPRNCSYCGEEATYYVYTDGVASVFACDDHHEQAVEDATPE